MPNQADAIITSRLDTSRWASDARAALRDIERGAAGLKLNASTFSRPLGSITADFNKFNQSLEASTARVLAFTASAGALYAFSRAIKEVVGASIQVEKSLTDINVILNTTRSGLKTFGNELFLIAKKFRRGF